MQLKLHISSFRKKAGEAGEWRTVGTLEIYSSHYSPSPTCKTDFNSPSDSGTLLPRQAILEARVTSLEMSYSEVTHFSEDIIQNLWAKMGCGEMTRLKPNFLLENANLKLWKIKRRWIVCECVCVVCMCVQVYMSDRCEYECYVCIYNMCVCGVCICVCGVHVCTSICEW